MSIIATNSSAARLRYLWPGFRYGVRCATTAVTSVVGVGQAVGGTNTSDAAEGVWITIISGTT